MAAIRPLGEALIGKIAAGEVVERPASVVKELVENSLDAGATAIRVELEAGGKRRILVSDDGCGIGAADVALAFERHATSKIAEFDDLMQVSTLGFRGEALSSIAAVARVELRTATAAGEGWRVRIEGGRILESEPAAHRGGTRVEVGELFYNVPARRAFLKTRPTELRRAVEVVQGYALARPDVRFTLEHEGRSLVDAEPCGDGLPGARRRIAQLFGKSLAEHLLELPGSSASRVWGFVGDPTTTRGRRTFVFVNRRLLRDRAVLGVFYRAVREEWRGDDFPALFLFLDLPPDQVDVNVHPQKAEVRFRSTGFLGEVFHAVRAALRPALGELPAPLTSAGTGPAAPLAWQGLGGAQPARGAQPTWGGQAHEGTAAGRISEPVYDPPARAPVPLSGRDGVERSFRLLGQYKAALILLEGPDGLYVIDQHVAHERILYERFRRELRQAKGTSQPLLEPAVLELGAAEAARLRERAGELESAGFALRELSGGSLGLAAVPAVLGPGAGEKLLVELAGEAESAAAGESLAERLLDALAASQACRAAVKMHDPLSPAELEALVVELFEAEQPFTCPHGRPVVLRLTDADLERHFGRR